KEENYKLADGTNVRTVVGNTSRLGGTTLLSAYFQGTRNVPFYVTLKEKGNQTEVSATALGSESVLKFDWGRNKKVAENLVGYCNTAAPSAASTGSDYDSSSNSTGKPAQTNAQKPQQK
ncbi:MAG: hypothetical protein NT043_05500, partial [Candidatus Bathyarchaeota archaeon]|nr:hypothetical protein [Candidatus Bathyarchaeota archaeon]